ncbi:MAG: VWA domain-containing protein [Candidatus Aenigmarchaeota archaeon]|nr:VWA domain-containing protein [Candidatus Aenigmarchaeota archaeon]
MLENIIKKLASAKQYLLSGVLCASLLASGGKRINAGDEGMDLPIGPNINYSEPQRQEPPRIPPDEDRPTFNGDVIYGARNSIVYVIDTSGSMGYEMGGTSIDLEGRVRRMTRLQRGQIELKRSIMALAPNFRFNIVYYDCRTDAWQRSLVPASEQNKRKAYRWIDGLYPYGGTGTAYGVSYALKTDGDNRDIVLLTDGRPTCNLQISEHIDIIRRSDTDGTRIHVFAISAYGPFRRFCVDIASFSGGSYHDVR